MRKETIFVVLECFFQFFVKTEAKLPGDLPTCKTGPNFEECLARGIETFIVKYGKTGIPEINLPRFDPIEIGSLTIGAGTGAVHVVQNYKNVKLLGYTDGPKVENTRWDAENLNLTFTTIFPKLEQKAEYDMNGRLLVIPVSGHGPSTLTFLDVEMRHKLHFVKENRKNDVFFTVKSYELNVSHTRQVRFLFENLFDGNKELGDNINKILNDEWKAVYDDVKDGYTQAYVSVFKQYADRVFAKIPANIILPN